MLTRSWQSEIVSSYIIDSVNYNYPKSFCLDDFLSPCQGGGFLRIRDNVATCVSQVVSDGFALVSAAEQAEKALTIESFVKTCSLMQKFVGNKSLNIVKDFLQESAWAEYGW